MPLTLGVVDPTDVSKFNGASRIAAEQSRFYMIEMDKYVDFTKKSNTCDERGTLTVKISKVQTDTPLCKVGSKISVVQVGVLQLLGG